MEFFSLFYSNIFQIIKKRRNNLSIFSLIKNSNIENKTYVGKFTKFYWSSMKRYSYIGDKGIIINTDIGKFCSIGTGCSFGLAKHPINFVSTSPVFLEGKNSIRVNLNFKTFNPYDKRIFIGNDVWIGNDVTILQNKIISDGAVIGANSVVTHNVGPYEIWAGNPARFIRKRFDEDYIKELLLMKWWDWPEDRLKNHSDYIDDLPTFIKKGRSN